MYTNKCSKNTYYLPHRAKCLSNVNGSLLSDTYNLHYFFASSSSPQELNEIHLIKYNEQDLCVRNVAVFEHVGEVEQMVCFDSLEENGQKKILLCTSSNTLHKKLTERNFPNQNGSVEEKQSPIVNNNSIDRICTVWEGCLHEQEGEEIIEKEEEEEEEEEQEEKEEQEQEQDEEKEKEKKNDKKEKENEINESLKKNDTYKSKLKQVHQLKSDVAFKHIKKIAMNDYEQVFDKIAIIDKYSYSIFEKGKNNIHFKQSSSFEVELNYAVFDPHHQNILTLMSDTCIYGYDITTNKKIFSTFTNHNSKLSSIDFNPNIPNIITSSSNDGNIKFWDLRFLRDAFFTINLHTHWITSIQFNNFHDELLLTTSTDHSVKLHRVEFSKNLNCEKKETNYKLVKTYKDHEESVYQAKWSKTDAWIFASLSYDGKCVINSIPVELKYKILL